MHKTLLTAVQSLVEEFVISVLYPVPEPKIPKPEVDENMVKRKVKSFVDMIERMAIGAIGAAGAIDRQNTW